MVKDLLLDSVNTHLPLRERIRVALESQKNKGAVAASLASATPEQLNEIGRATQFLRHMQQNRLNYADHLAELSERKPIHYNSLASIGNQIEDAQVVMNEAIAAVYKTVSPEATTESEVEAILQAYVEAKDMRYDPSR